MIHETFIDFHLGDNFIHAHFLRGLAKLHPQDQFVHYLQPQYIEQCSEVVSDLTNIFLLPIADKPSTAINAWKNRDRIWEHHPSRWDWSAFHLWFFGYLAAIMDLRTPFKIREDLLFDYPALDQDVLGYYEPFDFLIINSQPCSGQLLAYNSLGYMDELISALVAKKYRVLCTMRRDIAGAVYTQDLGLSVTGIGNASRDCKHHIMVATGPMWPTLNTTCNHFREGRHRLLLLEDPERLNMPEIKQVQNVGQVFEFAKAIGWL